MRRGLRLVAELVRLHPAPFVVSVAGSCTFAAGTVLATVVLGRVVDRIVLPAFETGHVPDGALPWGVVGVASLAVVRAAGVVTRRYFAAMTSERAQISLRHRLVDQYLGLPLSWHQQTPTGQLLAHADSDTEVATEVLSPLPFSLGAGFLALFSAIALIVVDPLIAVVALLVFPALVALNQVYSRRIEGPAAAVQASVGRVSSIAHESFDGALVVKTLGRAGAENQRFSVAVRKLQAHRQQVGYLRAAFEAVLDAVPNLGIVIVVVVGAFRIEAGAMTQGDLVQVASLFSVLAFPIHVLGFFLEMMPPSVVSRQRLSTVFDERRPQSRSRRHGLPGGELPVSACQVGFSYGPDATVLVDVNLDIRAGEVVALVGSTGSGKSTLCTVLAGLVPPSDGEVRLGHLPIDQIDPLERTEAVALVFQESFLFADTVRSNIDLTGRAPEVEVLAAAATARVDRFLEDLPDGLDTVLGERGVTLSGGQRQRVALARALLRHPRLLLLDDATSAVDAVVEKQILAGLRAEVRATTLIVAQRVSTIELADRVLYLDGGRIAATGTHAELLGNPGYEAIVRAYEEAAT
jgi:ABC-type multidrug transport system fused ATPase/permease subunit